MDTDRKNVALLATSQALLLTNNIVLIAMNGLVGHELAANKALATLPVTAYFVGGSLSTLPASFLMQRIGRRGGFTIGAVLGIAGAAVCALAVSTRTFWLFCAGNAISGAYNACAQYYRFAAADSVAPGFKSRAISLVLAGGIAGGVLGPESSKRTRDLLSVPFLGSYVSLILFAAIVLVLVRGLRIPTPPRDESRGGRPLGAIAAQPVFIVAVLGATVGYAVMNLLMTATPLAMQSCHHPYDDTAFVIEWHVIGMFAPSFFTGSLVQRFGVIRVMLTGAALMFGCVGIALSGVDLMHFWVALVLLGIGWNFLYIGGTTLLTEAYAPEERAKTQGLNDFLIFVTVALSSFASGLLVTRSGWTTLNLATLPLLAAATIALVVLGPMRQRIRAS